MSAKDRQVVARPGLVQLPLRTPTLPPAAHTNAYLVGHERLVLVDPATYEETERAVLAELVEAWLADGARLEAVVLTHHHADHVGSARWASERFGVPIWAHALTGQRLTDELELDRHLDEGDVVDLGVDQDGAAFRLEVLFTPGHAPGHLVLVDPRGEREAIIAGDMVAATGSIIIDPDDGDMARYLRELERLAARNPALVLPAHGPPIADGVGKLRAYVAHRLLRERKVLDALAAQPAPAPPEALLAAAYDDTPTALHPLAARACLAHLLKLEAEGRAERVGPTQWRALENQPPDRESPRD